MYPNKKLVLDRILPQSIIIIFIEWSFNGDIIKDFNDKEILDIHNIDVPKVGTYACNVSNLVGYDYKMVIINYNYKLLL